MKLLKTIPGLEKFCNAIWGGGTTEVVHVQDVGTKLFGKIYIDKISKKAYRCIANPSTTSTDLTASNFEACNVVDNLDKLQNLVEKPRELMRHIGSIALNTNVNFNENKNNFHFLILRIICNQISGNLDNGADCQDIILHSSREGYYYGNSLRGKICFSINHSSVRIGGTGNDNQFCQYGFAILGILRK